MSKTAKIVAGVGVATGVIVTLWYLLQPPTPSPGPNVEVILSWD